MPWYIVVLYIGSICIASWTGNNSALNKLFNYIGFILLATLVWLLACKVYGC